MVLHSSTAPDNGAAEVTPIDLADGLAGPAIRVGRFPRQIAITPDGATAYLVSNRVVTIPNGITLLRALIQPARLA